MNRFHAQAEQHDIELCALENQLYTSKHMKSGSSAPDTGENLTDVILLFFMFLLLWATYAGSTRRFGGSLKLKMHRNKDLGIQAFL